MDDAAGELHPVFGAALIGKLRFFFFGNHKQANDLAMLVAFHSRYLSARYNREPSKLCWPDKLSLQFDPMWFYLIRARLSGELKEYRLNAAHALPLTESNKSWFKWIRAKCALVAYNKTPGSIRNSPIADFSKTM